MFEQVLQIYSHLIENDAVSNIIRDFSVMFDEYNIENRLLSISIAGQSTFDKKKWTDVANIQKKITSKTLIIFHFAMPTPLSFIISKLNCPKVLLYHNVTPPVFFEKYNQNLKNIVTDGLREIIYMAPYFSCAWGVSEYNCSQLREAGYTRTSVANPPYDFSRFSAIQPNKKIIKWPGIKNILFVGRIAPNKCYEDIIKAFYYYHRINPNSELTLIGSYNNFQNYKDDLVKLSYELKLPVNITGMVSIDELATYYQNADLFLCMSEHEGFCIPIIEAMFFGIPVLAFDSSAVTETVGNAGIIFKQKHFPSVAHLMDEILNNTELQEKMKTAGKERALYYSKENVSKRLIKLIEDYASELNI
jgi:glycosyltransferase involved in cell wall biosynthesis